MVVVMVRRLDMSFSKFWAYCYELLVEETYPEMSDWLF
jgi:hypothetical protein